MKMFFVENEDSSANMVNDIVDAKDNINDENNEYLGYDMSNIYNKDGSDGIIKSLSYDNLGEPNTTY